KLRDARLLCIDEHTPMDWGSAGPDASGMDVRTGACHLGRLFAASASGFRSFACITDMWPLGVRAGRAHFTEDSISSELRCWTTSLKAAIHRAAPSGRELRPEHLLVELAHRRLGDLGDELEALRQPPLGEVR